MPRDEPAKLRSSLVTPATEAADVSGEALVLSPLAALLSANVIPQGEIVQLLIKPSRWFVFLNSVRFAVATVLCLTALHVVGSRPVLNSVALSVQLGLFLIAGRVMWSTVQWMGRYYILTDLRVLRVSGVFAIEIQSFPLRKVQGVQFYSFVGERLLGKGCIEITGPAGKMIWQTVSRPRVIHRAVSGAVARAQSNGCGPL